MSRAQRIAHGLILGAGAALLAAWSLAVPVFESPDEGLHWQYARFLHDERRLPVYGPAFREANSPPLYYLLIAPLAAPGPVPEPRTYRTTSGAEFIADPPRTVVHREGDLGRYARVRLARGVSVACSVLTILFVILAGREVTGRASTGLLAGSLVATLPQFSFRGMSVSNDALVATFGALATWRLLAMPRATTALRESAVAALAVAAAVLTKATAILFAAPLALAPLLAPLAWRRRIAASAAGLALLFVLVGPWLARNTSLYGDPLAHDAMRTAVPDLVREKPLADPYFVQVLPAALGRSFVGVFGAMNVPLPGWAFAAYALLGLAALAGLARGLATRRLALPPLVIASSILAGNLAVVIAINRLLSQPQGRFLFPALAAIAALAAAGLESLPRWTPRASIATVAVTAAINLWALAGVVIPTYWPPPRVDRPFFTGPESEVPATIGRVTAGGSARLTEAPGTLWTVNPREWRARIDDDQVRLIAWGEPGDVPVLLDDDGDERASIGAWRDGSWHLLDPRGGAISGILFGQPGDVPVPGRYFGGTADALAVWRPADGTWHVRDIEGMRHAGAAFGRAGDVPVPADYDGDGTTDLGVWRPETGTWYTKPLEGPPWTPVAWGQRGDVPLPGQYAGDAAAELMVFRPATGHWYMLDPRTGERRTTFWGVAADVPVPLDHDGDGRLDLAVWRPATATWYILDDSQTFSRTIAFGDPAARPGGGH